MWVLDKWWTHLPTRPLWLCCNLSGGVVLIVWFTTNGMCVKNNTIICVERASNSKRDCEHDLYCCLLPRCEALRTCRSGFPIATAPNDASQDPNFCNQCKPWKLIALNMLLKTFTQLKAARKSRFAPNTPGPLCTNCTRHLIRFARNGSIQRSPHPWHRLSLKFGIFICDRNSNTCQKNRARTNLLYKTKIRRDYYCSSLYICHTKAITTLVEYGTRCLYEDTNFSLSW